MRAATRAHDARVRPRTSQRRARPVVRRSPSRQGSDAEVRARGRHDRAGARGQPVAGAGAGAKATHLSPGASEQRAHAACAGGRTPRAERWSGTRLHRRSSGPGDHGACARCGIPVPRQRILESTNWERASAERPGDHGACGRARKPGEVKGRTTALPEGAGDHGACAQGRIPVTWQRILESTSWARASGERQGVHGGRAVRGLASLCGGTRA